MCDCLQKKECCDCLKGGCDCACECSCHTGDANDPCWAFPTMFCPDCVARRKTVADDYEKMLENTKHKRQVPSDVDIFRVFGTKPIL